ncbi:MAG: hypothetical protein FWD49_05125 [Firmicutes bacterium]|nr:hypothetical protein [Bacillota bacterium]
MAVVATMIFTVILSLTGCSQKASRYTEAEHIQRVTERVEKRFMGVGSDFISFNVYSLFNEADELNYFLVEFEPVGFLFVKINKETHSFMRLFGGAGMYTYSGLKLNEWQRYTIDEWNNQPPPDKDKIWETDEMGEFIYYRKSPFHIANIACESRYLLRVQQEGNKGFIPAVRHENGFLNLISMEEMGYGHGNATKKQPNMWLIFPPKKEADL